MGFKETPPFSLPLNLNSFNMQHQRFLIFVNFGAECSTAPIAITQKKWLT
jgi:hypothetical protein